MGLHDFIDGGVLTLGTYHGADGLALVIVIAGILTPSEEVVGIDDGTAVVSLLPLALPVVGVGIKVCQHVPADIALVDTVDTHELRDDVGGEEIAALCEGIDSGGSGDLDRLVVDHGLSGSGGLTEAVVDGRALTGRGDGDHRLAGLAGHGEHRCCGLCHDDDLAGDNLTGSIAIAHAESLDGGVLSEGERLCIDSALCGGVGAVEGVVDLIAEVGRDADGGIAVLLSHADDGFGH